MSGIYLFIYFLKKLRNNIKKYEYACARKILRGVEWNKYHEFYIFENKWVTLSPGSGIFLTERLPKACVRRRAHTRLHAHTHAHTYMCVCIYMFIFIHTHTHARAHKHTYTHIHTRTHTHTHTHTHIYECIIAVL